MATDNQNRRIISWIIRIAIILGVILYFKYYYQPEVKPVYQTQTSVEQVNEKQSNSSSSINPKLGADYSKLSGEASPEYRYTEFRSVFNAFINSNPDFLVDEDSYRNLSLGDSEEYAFLNQYSTRYVFRKTGHYPEFSETANVTDFPSFIRKIWDDMVSIIHSKEVYDAKIGYTEAVNTAGERWAFIGVVVKKQVSSPVVPEDTAVAVRIY